LVVPNRKNAPFSFSPRLGPRPSPHRRDYDRQVNVRQAVPGDESTLRRLRLAAMLDSPEAFGSNYQRIANGATFFVEITTTVGLVAAIPDRDDRGVVHLMAMWVDPSARGTGTADALIDAVVAWASARDARTVATPRREEQCACSTRLRAPRVPCDRQRDRRIAPWIYRGRDGASFDQLWAYAVTAVVESYSPPI